MPVVNWPEHLVDRIAGDQWVLFIGSGVSASCTNGAGHQPPMWAGLLDKLCDMIADGDLRGVGKTLIARSELLAAADHIRYSLWQESNLDGYLRAIRTAVDGPSEDRFEPSSLFDVLLGLDPRIVFTTNYDRLFERASKSGFATHTFRSDGLSADLRRGEPVLVKLHGSTDAINNIVLTRTDYVRVTREGRGVFDALTALSLTSTILFVGYSLEDPDIQLVLQAVGRSGLSPEAHFMLAPEPASPARSSVFRESYGVSILTYPAGDHAKAGEALVELSEEVLKKRAARAPAAP